MKKKVCVFIFLLGLSLVPFFAHADENDPYLIEGTAGQAGLTEYGDSVPDLTGRVIGTALSMVVVLFLGLMIYGGIIWMTDRGNEERSKKALHAITAGVIGITIILASYAITTFVFKVGIATP